MKKIFVPWMYLLLAASISNGQTNNADKKALCSKEKENLKNLGEKLTDLKSEITDCDMYSSSIKGYLKTPQNKVTSKYIDYSINYYYNKVQSIKENIKKAGSATERDNIELNYAQSAHDYFAELRLKRQFGETTDPKNNDLQKALIKLQEEKDQLENSVKYLQNDIRMNKERLRQLNCDAIQNESTSEVTDLKSVVGVWDWYWAESGKTLERHGSVTFTSNGKMSWDGGSDGTWTQAGSTVSLTWTKGDKDDMTLEPDGHILSGDNTAKKLKVQGQRGIK